MSKNIKMSDLTFGSLNNIQDGNSGESGDRRRTSATTAIRMAVESAFAKDTLNNVTEFNGVVVSYRPVAYPSYSNKTALFNEYLIKSPNQSAASDKPQDYASVAYKVYIPELEPRPAPVSNNDPVLVTYPDVYSDIEDEEPIIELGTLVAVKFEDVENLFNPRIVRKIGGPIQIQNVASEKLNKKFKKGVPEVVGSSDSSDNVVYTVLLPGLPEFGANEYVTSDNPISSDDFARAVQTELSFWSGKTETTAAAYDRLTLYWENDLGGGGYSNTDPKKQNWTTSTAWSAAYISYILSRVDPQFPRWGAHYLYANAAKKKKGNWSLWKTKGYEGRIEAQVGDVLVKPRLGKNAKRTFTHGDAVYKIEDGYAYLTGGNLSNTAHGNIKLPLDGRGRYASYVYNGKLYEVLLKKNGEIKSDPLA